MGPLSFLAEVIPEALEGPADTKLVRASMDLKDAGLKQMLGGHFLHWSCLWELRASSGWAKWLEEFQLCFLLDTSDFW